MLAGGRKLSTACTIIEYIEIQKVQIDILDIMDVIQAMILLQGQDGTRPMPDKRVVFYHLRRLEDKNPDVRLKAIRELALLGDPEALDRLQDVFRNDPNPEVRKAAQEAGRTIFLRQRGQSV